MKIKIKHLVTLLLIVLFLFFEYYNYKIYEKFDKNLYVFEIIIYIINWCVIVLLFFYFFIEVVKYIDKNWNKTLINLSKQNEN